MAFVQLVSFEVSGDVYAVDINVVNGIIKSKSYNITKIPNAPKELEGCINLRGKISPVFNLKKKFQYPDDAIKEDSKIITIDNKGSIIGFIVDEVTDIFRLSDEDIESVPGSISNNFSSYLKGIGKIDGNIVLILDLIKSLSETDIQQLSSIKSMINSNN